MRSTVKYSSSEFLFSFPFVVVIQVMGIKEINTEYFSKKILSSWICGDCIVRELGENNQVTYISSNF